MNTEASIVEIGQIGTPAGEIRFLFLPDRDLFGRRAERLRHLSHDHHLGEYLAFLATLADAQQAALNQFPAVPQPNPVESAHCRTHGMPLLDTRCWPRNPAWRRALTQIFHQMGESSLPPAASETLSGLLRTSDARLEEMADNILSGDLDSISLGELPFVASALQVYWVQMASTLDEQMVGRLEQGGLCPVCGSHPVAGVVRSGGSEHGLRYLCCSLCASQWHMVRIKCSSCESTHGIDHYILEGSNGAIKAESCDDCSSYLKLMYLEKDGRMEAMADDLATLAMDMLMDKEGMFRSGPNLFLHPGSG